MMSKEIEKLLKAIGTGTSVFPFNKVGPPTFEDYAPNGEFPLCHGHPVFGDDDSDTFG